MAESKIRYPHVINDAKVQCCHGCCDLLIHAKAEDAIQKHGFGKHCSRGHNRQIQENLHFVRPIAIHYALKTGLDNDDRLQVGCLGLINVYNGLEAYLRKAFPNAPKPHIR